jgi:ppGpp synthetase/RelA/SpoT-type nucleotidyltranferase
MLIGQAQVARSPAERYAREVCREIGLDDPANHIVMGPTKELGRILEKAASQCSGNIRDVTDICRLTIVCDDAKTLAKARKLFFEGRSSDFHDRMEERSGVVFRSQPKDYMTAPKRWGYMALYLRMQADLGQGRAIPFELQITHRGLWHHCYPETHRLYESIRGDIEAVEAKGRRIPEDLSKEAQGVLAQILDIHRSGAESYGLMPLVRGKFPQLSKAAPRTDGQEIDILPPADLDLTL